LNSHVTREKKLSKKRDKNSIKQNRIDIFSILHYEFQSMIRTRIEFSCDTREKAIQEKGQK